MRTIAELLEHLGALDIRLALDGDRLSVNAPKGAIGAELRTQLAARKEELKEHLRHHAAPAVAALPSLVAVPRSASMPVSHTQQRLWFLRQMDPTSSAYNVVSALRMRGPLDAAALECSFDALLQRHESLRTRFFAVDGAPRCAVESEARAPLQMIDLSGVEAASRETQALGALLEAARTPFDLAHCPLLRVALVRLGPLEHLCCVVVDHIVADGISVAILFAELQALYRQRTSGVAAVLPLLPVQYLDYVVWQTEVFASGALDEHLAYWKQQLRGLPPVLALPTDRPRPRLQTHHGARRLELLPESLATALKSTARREGVTLYMLMLAAFELLLHRYSGEEDFAVGTVVGARDRPEVEPVVGFFANNIVLRADLSGNPSGRELLARVRETALKAYAHQEMPFDMLVEALAPRRDLDHSPLFQVLFVLHSIHLRRGEMDAVIAEPQELPLSTSRFDLAVDVFDTPDGMRSYFEYNTDLFDAATIERMMAHYLRLLEGLTADTTVPVRELPMLGGAERAGLRERHRGVALAAPPQASVHALFAAQARRTPDAEALRMDGASLSYAELDARTNRLAHHLLSLGVQGESLVGVWMERSIDMVVALLAVLKAGAAYVPLDPAFPRDRIEFMMQDAQLAAVLTHEALRSALPLGAPVVVTLDGDAQRLAAQPVSAPVDASGAGALAYVIYTSGSTGLPKGVQIEHGAVVNFLRSMHAEPGIGADDRLVSVTTLSFDIAGLEIFGPLTTGGTVVLASRATTLDGQRLAELLDAERATILQATPATWRLLLDSGWNGVRTAGGLKMLCGGEALPRELAQRLLGLPGQLWNMYGPTETTIWSTLSRVRDTQRPIAIGRPIAETTVHVLEASGLPAPVGVAGELCIGGAGVARGYRNRAELTAEKFVVLELGGGQAERVYRTGDVVRMRADGQLEFVGRRDHQVKLRGFRIELEEIETVLATHPGVRQCVAAVREDRPGDQRLVAYVVSAEGPAFDAEAARGALRQRLPEYMIPNLFVALDALPLTPNGKVDRKALPAPVPQAGGDAPAQALMNPAQQRVADAWRDVLRHERVGLHDNFFDLGGHSLLLVKLQVRLQRDFGVELPLVELFQRTTVAAQAERLAASGRDDSTLQRARERAARQIHA